MNKSASIANIAKALVTFHGLVGKIPKDSNNPFFKSKYASLSDILDKIQGPLNDSELTYVQFPGKEGLTTMLMHPASGEWIEDTYDVKPIPDYLKEKDRDGNVLWRGSEYITPQSLGSAITYARRYSIGAILGLNIDEDDDGNAASGNKTNSNAASQTNKQTPPVEQLNPAWAEALSALKTETDLTTFYKQNKKAVDASPALLSLFGEHKQRVKSQSK